MTRRFTRKKRSSVWRPSEKYPTRESYLSQRAKSNKTKGADGEYEAATLLRSLGFAQAIRGSRKDLEGTQPLHVECKNVRRSTVLKWMWQSINDCIRFKQAGFVIPTVLMKYNDNWYFMVPVMNLKQFCTEVLRKMRGK